MNDADAVNSKDIEPGRAQASPRTNATNDFALVIGIDDYPLFRPLNGAKSDALRFHKWLCDPLGGGVDLTRAWLVTSTSTPTMPDQKKIDDALEELINAAIAVGGGRRLYFYFSGHGAADRKMIENVAMLLSGWAKSRPRLGLSSQLYTNDLVSYGLFDEVAVFLDCCRADDVAVVGVEPTYVPQGTWRKTSSNRLVAYACRAGGSAFELPVGPAWQGVFTGALLDILTRTPGGVSARDLPTLLKREVLARNVGQEVQVDSGLDDWSFFGTASSAPELVVTFSLGRQGPVELKDGSFQSIAFHDPATGPMRRRLPPGLYLLIDASKEEEKQVKHAKESPHVF